MGNKNGCSKIPPGDLKELLTKTHFDAKELKRWYNGFVEDCPHGSLNREQFIDMYGSVYTSGNGVKFAEHVFRTFDYDGDGHIDFREFISSLSVITRGTLKEKLEWTFNIYDIDKNGYITTDEMVAIVESMKRLQSVLDDSGEEDGKMGKEALIGVFEKMDRNLDGQLSLEEFIKGVKEDDTFIKLLKSYTPDC